ncbi:unnamed protein product [Cuscuta epithymum]|uniref:RRM domain-containing protein n=1 Tax=Cuscuta epithymum TaxID=186058 RepID=A0AAV0DSI5_9ASTE|nr:unnamed protein product [Cuscuta epithymum]CAH9109113.1 unnamed protein product [Cuscuta epithymum]CAH9143560.1 unnamed protein product [Cuscuta epithymum]
MAEASLSMSLDDLIKKNRGSGGSRRGRGAGPDRRIPNRSSNRHAPYETAKAPNAAWNHDMFSADQPTAFPGQIVGGGRASSIETGTKLFISNLEYGVSNEDLKELFSDVGDMKRYGIHYDRSGRSKGTADVVFSRRQDALAAIKRYHNVQLDGKPMKIEIVGTNIVTPAPPVFPSFGNPTGILPSGQGRSGGFGRPRGGRGRGRGFQGGRGRGRDRGDKKVSAEDLDEDLAKYHSEAMQTN